MTPHSFTVRVILENGDPFPNVHVYAAMTNMFGYSDEGYTGWDGRVELEMPTLHATETIEVNVTVKGETYGPYDVTTGEEFTIEI